MNTEIELRTNEHQITDHIELFFSIFLEHQVFARSSHRSMAKLLILAASSFFPSMGTTTSPQQQNPQADADKDPCEVL